MTPLERYQADLQSNDFSADPAQERAVQYTQSLYDALVSTYEDGNRLFTRIKMQFKSKGITPIEGLYFWGGVGRGKTYLIDAFYDSLPFPEKTRIHFHRFMHMVHHELKQLKNIEDPLQAVADNLAAKTWVICFDEFHVSDITDAMLLSGLLNALFDRGVTLVTTSNEAPDQLYKDGLQRDRFLPVIDLIKQHTKVVNIDSGIDYRLRFLDQAEIYHCPLDELASNMLCENFEHIAPDAGIDNLVLEIEGRPIRTVRCANGVAWFKFSEVCDGPRGPADYIEMSRLFQTVLISNIPVLTDTDDDQAKRFMILVDEFYDHNVKLIVTAAAQPAGLYTGKRHAKPFKRCISRLLEMRTHDYLARQHLP